MDGACAPIPTVSPSTGEVVSETPAADAALVRVADLLERDRDEIARLAAIEIDMRRGETFLSPNGSIPADPGVEGTSGPRNVPLPDGPPLPAGNGLAHPP